METGGQKVRNRHSTKYYWDKTEYLHEFSEVLHLHSQKTPHNWYNNYDPFYHVLEKTNL